MFKSFRKRKYKSSDDSRSADGSIWSEKLTSRVQNLVSSIKTKAPLRRFKSIFTASGSSDASFHEDAWDAGLSTKPEDGDDDDDEGIVRREEITVEQVKEYYVLTPPLQRSNTSSKETMPVFVGSDPGKLHLELGPDDPTPRKSPVTVREWVDSLPPPDQHEEERLVTSATDIGEDVPEFRLGEEAVELCSGCPTVVVAGPLPDVERSGRPSGPIREPSVQSDVVSHAGSHASSMESYLDSRRPDPEEILMGLGFGGCVGELDVDISRIPRRFLQPSKVKGVDIDDFLRHQQNIIETFESGFYGYRGLIGPSHTPSVIVAKIMEKLREHERDNYSQHSVISHTVSAPSARPHSSGGRFSRIAHNVAKRASVASALSVLSPANRQFLDSQGGKSPEVQRKRMIIGQRSFTFGCDGDLVEIDSPAPVSSTPPRPLLHKDSVLSTVTTISMTSVDSDTDSDDHRSDFRGKQGSFYTSTPLNRSGTCEPNKSSSAEHSALPKNNEADFVEHHGNDGLAPVTECTEVESIPDLFLAIEKEVTENIPDEASCDDNVKTDDLIQLQIPDLTRMSVTGSKDESADGRYRRGSLKRQRHVSETDDVLPQEESEEQHCNPNLLHVAPDVKADSFEIEEISIPEDECGPVKLARMRSDSSGFLDFDGSERRSPEDVFLEDSANFTTPKKFDIGDACDTMQVEIGSETGSSSTSARKYILPKYDFHETLKRLSLPVVRIHDEYGRTGTLTHSCEDVSVSSPQIKRSRSAPNSMCLSDDTPDSELHSCSSFNDVFSFCSAESIVLNKSAASQDGATCSSSVTLSDADAASCSTKDYEELIYELTGMQGLERNIPKNSDTRQEWLQKTLRLAVESYRQRLASGSSSSSQHTCVAACPEAHRELQQIREHITFDLRRIADLLDEPPSKELTAVTKQMTALLREQARLCRLLNGVTKYRATRLALAVKL